jgi:hypothetical protein
MRSCSFQATLLLAFVIVGIGTSRARAISSADAVARRQLIGQAETSHDAGDHNRALDLALRAAAIEMSTSLRYFLAREQEETGALADSYSSAAECLTEAEHDHKLRNRAIILRECRQIGIRIEVRIGKIVITVPERPPGMRIKVGGQDFNEAVIGLPYVVAPGTIAVEASAPDRTPFRESIRVDKGQTVNVAVKFSRLQKPTCLLGTVAQGSECVKTPEPATPPLPARPLVAVPTEVPVPAPASPSRRHIRPAMEARGTPTTVAPSVDMSRRDTASTEIGNPSETGDGGSPYGLYAAVAGGVTLFAGSVVYFISGSEFSSLKDGCNSVPQQNCSTSRYDDGVTRVQTLDRVAHVSWLVGGLLAGGGLVHYFWLGGSQPRAHEPGVAFDPIHRTFGFESSF